MLDLGAGAESAPLVPVSVRHNPHLRCRGRCGLDLIKGAGFGAGAAQTQPARIGTKGSGVGAGAGQAQFQFSSKSITACPTILIAVILAYSF